MKTLVVFCAIAAMACGSLVPLAQPPHHPAVVLDPHGRPLDTADVINARAIHLQAKALEHSAPLVHAAVVPAAYSVAAPIVHDVPAVIAAPVAVSHQSRVDVHTSPAFVSHAIATPVLAHSALGLAGHGHGHWLKKRSLGHLAYSAPIIAPSAVSHQARVDVISSPAVVSHAVATPVVAHAVHTPVVAVAPAAVSHQSRVDVRTSPAVVAHAVATPVVSHFVDTIAPVAHNYWDATVYGAHSHGHFLKKRSLAAIVTPYVHAAPAAVSHQSRVDVVSSPAVVAHVAPVAVEHVVPAAVSHQARVDVISSGAHVAPLAHHAVLTTPTAHWGYSRLFNGHW